MHQNSTHLGLFGSALLVSTLILLVGACHRPIKDEVPEAPLVLDQAARGAAPKAELAGPGFRIVEEIGGTASELRGVLIVDGVGAPGQTILLEDSHMLSRTLAGELVLPDRESVTAKDGSFEFLALAPGKYDAWLDGGSNPILNGQELCAGVAYFLQVGSSAGGASKPD
tara:strand:- start:3654 stop:4160 length:507 start_codon:yes stop_codon:yes gene_type:complete